MNLFRRILESEEFEARPPVLFDIGASSRLVEQWENIARYSVIVAFDPDSRLTGHIEKADSRYRRLLFIPRLVTAEPEKEIDFYLTASPECSSCLPPNFAELRNWYHAGFFEVTKKQRTKSITLPEVLDELKLDYIDGFKIDAQGADLRIYRSLPTKIRKRISAIEIEPGIMNAYVGEDKLYDVLRYFERKEPGFGVFDCRVQKAWYLPTELKKKYLSPLQARLVPTRYPAAPGWAELSLLRRPETLKPAPRSYQMAWIFAMIYRQYGLALQLADSGREKFGGELFDRMVRESLNRVPLWFPLLKKCVSKVFFSLRHQ